MGIEPVQNPGRFLAGVAGVIRNPSGAYLMMRRSKQSDFGFDVWECVTGRVNQGEGYESALHREVLEETGLTVRIDTILGLSHFYRGDRVAENELQGVVFGCSIEGGDSVVLGPEHSELRWLSADEALSFLTAEDPGTIWFRTTILRAEQLYALLPDGWAGIHAAGVTLD